MQLENFTASGLLRRWYLLDKQARCPFDAVEPARLSPAQRDAILAQNADVRQTIAELDSYEAAKRLKAGEEPLETISGTDENGDAAEIENPVYAEWVEAGETIRRVRHVVSDLAKLRAGEYPLDEQGEPIVPQPDEPGPDPLADLPPYDPAPEEISDRQFAQELAIRGVITETEAIAWAGAGALPAAMSAAINQLPVDRRFAAKMSLASATTYRRSHPLADMLGGLLGYDAAGIDNLWRASAAHI